MTYLSPPGITNQSGGNYLCSVYIYTYTHNIYMNDIQYISVFMRHRLAQKTTRPFNVVLRDTGPRRSLIKWTDTHQGTRDRTLALHTHTHTHHTHTHTHCL